MNNYEKLTDTHLVPNIYHIIVHETNNMETITFKYQEQTTTVQI